ncbi:hypothetical protein [aff. Roholtiella sp. LEGE 12411]|uniref:hypothetical protein n=1 Tax=aff. Roholtiella sp. LEGE 12411 TaxID=1828822 RepID=UPI00187EB68A|nr:hypothetical protein [aff. Roholtiella sp. LEGE 12411]MBE9039114.1 hypothetical protein [aff. Roholtiella sp. LEGE 12411]
MRQSYQDWKGQSIEAKRAQLRGESKDLPVPVHIQKEPPFWDVFPENPGVFKLVVQARALGILRLEENRSTKEKVIRYTRETVIGAENVEIASSWEEAVQVLEVLACRPDKEAIQRQVSAKLADADQQAQDKPALYDQLMNYLKQREAELEKVGGSDSPDYKREATIIQDLITSEMQSDNKSKATVIHVITPEKPPDEPSEEPPIPNIPSVEPFVVAAANVFCTECGMQNPAR